MNDHIALAEALFPDVSQTLGDLTARYPGRTLVGDARVTRFAPSPTGFMHLGSLLTSLISERVAHLSGGVFYLRIEDTDKKREVEGTIDIIVNSLRTYHIPIDEGEVEQGKEVGAYGPYKQSERLDMYRACVKHLVETGRAYPCFCTTEELSALSAQQEEQKIRPGYRGKWATCRTKSVEEALALVHAGTPYVLRLRSEGNFDHKIPVLDLIKGQLSLSENDLDVVLLKSDNYPTYHLAHVVDDHFMGTTDVIRGDEWLSSTPLHMELWNAFGWSAARYGHMAPIQKIDEGSRRKLSKRKDPEANLAYYEEKGYPPEAVIEYLLNLANSSFEDWRKEHVTDSVATFPFSLKKLNNSGALFDEVKLESVSKEVIARMSTDETYERIVAWLTRHDSAFYTIITSDPVYTKKILSIEKDTTKRKDIRYWSDVRGETTYFFDVCFVTDETLVDMVRQLVAGDDAKKILDLFVETYNPIDDRELWFAKVKQIASALGYAEGVKEYKKDPTSYKGHVGTISQVLRIAMTGKTNTPDLHDIMSVLGSERVHARIAEMRALL
jgi:glutamyl-tRNA synthetase